MENIKREWKRSELKLVKEGKKPFFLKKCNFIFDNFIADIKKIELVDRFNSLKDVQKFME